MLAIFIFTLLNLLASFNFNAVKSVDVDDIKIEEYNDYVLLASDVQEYFKARSVFIIYAGNDESIRTTTLMRDLIHNFSSKSVLSLNQNYTDVLEYRLHYRNRIIRPLFVVFLSTTAEIQMFRRVAENYDDMSYPSWLLIFTERVGGMCSRPPGNYLKVAFDTVMLVKCYGDATIREWYSLSGDKLIIKDLAVWDTGNRLMLKTKKSLYERRNTLDGKKLHIATVRESPFVEGQAGPLGGLFATILIELSESLNFSINIKYKEDSYGTYDARTRSWSGVIGRLVNKEVDIGVSEFTMTKERLDAVDFTLPIMLSRNHLYMRQPDYSALQWSAYFKVYTYDVWLVTGFMFVFSSLVVLTIRVIKREKPLPPNIVSETCLYVLGILCQQGVPEFPESSPTRIAYFSILLKSVVFQAIYSACLISYLTLTTPSLPFNGIFEFAMDGSYRLIAFQQSADYDLFASAKDWVLMKMMKQMRAPEYLPKTMMAGFRQACERKVAFYATEAVKSYISGRIPCDLVFIKTGRIDSLGLTLTKKSQYTGVINYHLQKFKDVGIMNRLKSQVYTTVLSSDNRYNSVGIRGVVTILLILFAGIVVSFAILTFEILSHRASSARNNRRLISTLTNRIVVTKNTYINVNKLPECEIKRC